ncbi:hypothetical protein RB195_006423 [Necator americanus]|uniref:Uncharacterized protein n=1 Tax=Necator americanus TaxID=51031 RepID=A0ABR1BW27_NECAM
MKGFIDKAYRAGTTIKTVHTKSTKQWLCILNSLLQRTVEQSPQLILLQILGSALSLQMDDNIFDNSEEVELERIRAYSHEHIMRLVSSQHGGYRRIFIGSSVAAGIGIALLVLNVVIYGGTQLILSDYPEELSGEFSSDEDGTRRRRKKKRPKKMKSAVINPEEFKTTAPLVHMRNIEGEVKHALEKVKSKELTEIKFDPSQNEITAIGSTIDMFDKPFRKTIEFSKSAEAEEKKQNKTKKKVEEKKPAKTTPVQTSSTTSKSTPDAKKH